MSIHTKPKIKKKIRYAEYYDMTKTFDTLYHNSQQGKIFTNLMEIILSEENIKLAYADNRISLYAAQKGRCAITGQELSLDEIHCHHKKPVRAGGTDSYFNLVIVHVQVHRLIHATDPVRINSYLADLNLSPAMLKKVNKFREMASLKPIS